MTMKPDRKAAIFPGSFDPFTLGHMDVLQSALKLFDKIYIAVGYNHLKHGFLPPQTRVALIQDAVRPLIESGADIEVLSYTGLTVNLCREKNTGFIIRGLVFIPASHSYSFISSTVVRDVIINGGDAAPFMPSNIRIEDYLNKTI